MRFFGLRWNAQAFVEWKMMLDKANLRMVAIAMAIAGILLPRLGIAEDYGSSSSLPSYNASTSSAIGRAESALNPVASALGGAAGKPGSNVLDNLQKDLAERLNKSRQALEVSKKETELRNKVEGWRKQIDQLKTALAIPDIIADRKLKEKEEKTKQLQGLFAQMPTQAQGLNAAALDTSKLGEACRSGVDFAQFRALLDQTKSEPFQYLKREGKKIAEEPDEKIKKKKIESGIKLAAHFDNLAKQPVGAGQEGAQQDINSGKLDLFKRDNSLEARLIGLEKTGEAQKKEIPQLRQEVVNKIFKEVLPALDEADENDKKIETVVGSFADSLLAMVRASKEKGVAGAAKTKSNCDALTDRLGKNNPLAPGTLFNAAYQWVSTINASYANSAFFSGVQQAATRLKCVDVTAQVEQLLGQNLENQIQVIRQVRDPKQAIEGAMQLVNLVGSTLAQVGDVIQPALQACKRNEDFMKKVEQFVQSTQQQNQALAQQQQQQGEGRTRSTSSNQSVRGGSQNRNTHSTGSRLAPTTL